MDTKYLHPNLAIHRYEVTIKALTPFVIPHFPGSMLRGAFGVALKRVVCLNKNRSCESCLLQKGCVYQFLFETQTDIAEIKNPPHPMMLYPLSLGGKKMRQGSIYQFGFTLFGQANEYLPYIIYALMQMGKLGMGKGRGKFEIKEIKKYVSFKRKRIIFSQKTQRLLSPSTCLNSTDILQTNEIAHAILLKTITPLRFKIKGRLTDKISLKDILIAIIRRFKTLTQLYGQGKVFLVKELNLEPMLSKIQVKTNFKWQDFTRFSKRQNAHLQIGGAMGEMEISGDVSDIFPILHLGEYIHIGKNTAFGLGRYYTTILSTSSR